MTAERRAPARHPLARPVRTCIGCRSRATKSDLLRLVAVGGPAHATVVPDPLSRMPGRGAYLHLDPGCLDLADRRRAFGRALRLVGALDTSAVRTYVEAGDQGRDETTQATTRGARTVTPEGNP